MSSKETVGIVAQTFGILEGSIAAEWVWLSCRHNRKGVGLKMDLVPYCVIGTTGTVCCCNSQWELTENLAVTGVNKNLNKSCAVVDCWGGCDVPGSVCAGTGCRLRKE